MLAAATARRREGRVEVAEMAMPREAAAMPARVPRAARPAARAAARAT